MIQSPAERAEEYRKEAQAQALRARAAREWDWSTGDELLAIATRYEAPAREAERQI